MKTILALVLAACIAPSGVAAQRLKLSVPLEQLEHAAKADSNDATAHYNLALGYWSKGQWGAVERSLDQALALEPRFALAHLARAYLPFARRPKLWRELDADDVPTAELPTLELIARDYRRAFFFNPLVDLRIVGAVTPPKSYIWEADDYLSAIYDTWVRAFEDFSGGDYASAYRRFQRMAEEYTATGKNRVDRIPTQVLWYQGLAAAQLGMYDAAIRNVQEVLERAEEETDEQKARKGQLIYNPLRANEYRYVLGVLHVRAGQLDRARRYLEKAAEQDLGLYMAHVHLAAALEQEGRWPDAVVERRAAFDANPEDPTSAIELAITLSKVGGTSETERLLEEVARTNPRNARAHYLLGLVKHQLGKGDEAKAAFQHFLAIAPQRATREVADAKQRLLEF